MVRNVREACRGVDFKDAKARANAIKRAPVLATLIQNGRLKIDEHGSAIFPSARR